MLKILAAVLFVLFFAFSPVSGQTPPEKDVLSTSGGDLEIVFLGHGTLMMVYNTMVIHVDPYSKVADYSRLPKADIILVTHDHGDHLDPTALGLVRTDKTRVVLTELCARTIEGDTVLKNGDIETIGNLKIEAVPAYNISHRRDTGQVFHPKGEGNGYVITFGDKRLYIAGDTENIPEMNNLRDIDYAFLPMNLPYTMTPEMVADAARSFKPTVLYPYHYGETDPALLLEQLKDSPEIETRIRSMQ